MIVSIVGCSCYVYREPGDPVFRPNRSKLSWSPPGWYGAESRLLYNVQKILNGRGYDLLKKRMWRDGHMFGCEHIQYLRSRNLKSVPSLYIYHANYALEVAAESYNVLGRVRLDVAYGAGREDDPDFEQECREWVRRREIAHPLLSGLVEGRGHDRRLLDRSPPLSGLHEPGPGRSLPPERPWRVVPTDRPTCGHGFTPRRLTPRRRDVTNTPPSESSDEDHGDSCKFNGHDLTRNPVLNPGGWFGKTWLIEIGGILLAIVPGRRGRHPLRRHRRTQRRPDLRAPDPCAGVGPRRLPRRLPALRRLGAGDRPRSRHGPRSGRLRPAVPGALSRRIAAPLAGCVPRRYAAWQFN